MLGPANVAAARGERRGAAPLAPLLVLGVAVACGFAIYQPWVRTPFGIDDFSEFLPFLKGNPTFASRLRAMSAYYQHHGRYNIAACVAVIAKWELFGADPRLWQLARAAQMVAIVPATFALLRRLSRSTAASVAGAALLLVGTGASAGWTWLTTGEPLATLGILLGAYCALRIRETRNWVPYALAIAAAAAVIVLTKEALVVLLPFVAIVLVSPPGEREWLPAPAARRRVALALGVLFVAVALASIPVALTLHRARTGGYVSNYNTTYVGVRAFLRLLATMLLPIRLETAIAPGLRSTALMGDVLFAVVVLAGWATGLRAVGRRALGWLAAALWLPASLALVYLPWPEALNFYLLPALVGDALLLAFALDFIGERLPVVHKTAVAASVLASVAAALVAYQHARQAEAKRIVDGEVVAAIARLGTTTPVVVAQQPASLKPPPNQWMGKGPVLGRDATVLYGRALLPVTDVACAFATDLVRRGVPVVVYSAECGRVQPPRSVALRAYYRYFDVHRAAVAVDSAHAALLLPDPSAHVPAE